MNCSLTWIQSYILNPRIANFRYDRLALIGLQKYNLRGMIKTKSNTTKGVINGKTTHNNSSFKEFVNWPYHS